MALPFKSCNHLETITSVKKAAAYECSVCVEKGDSWLHLRTCQTCGVTLCCDSSPNQHASKHVQQSEHPVIASAEPGERWLWCYSDKTIKQY